MAFLISLLTGRALLWARAIWNSQSSIINSFDAFSAHFREVFGLSTSSLSIADQLIRLRQGTSSVSVYTLQFRTLAASCGWNETALLITCRRVLDPQIRAKMAIYDDNVGLESFMQKAVNISSDSQPACSTKPFIHKPHPLPVLQYQNPCSWTPTDSLARNVRDISPLVCAYICEHRGTSSKSALLVPHASGEYTPG